MKNVYEACSYPARRPELRRLTLCTLLASLLSINGFAQLKPGGKTAVGLNIDVNEQSLVNLVELMSIPDSNGQDSNGWPTSDFTLLLDNRYIFAWSPENPNVDPLKYSTSLVGQYRLTYTGKAFVFRASNSRYDPATNTTSADYDIDEASGGPGNLLLRIYFYRTQRTPEGPVGSGVTNIRLVRTDYAQAPKQIFTNLWVDSIRKYSWAAFRCMEALKTNDYGAPGSREAYPYRLNWETERRLPGTGPLYGKAQLGVHGRVPWEAIVTVGQLTHRDLWINIPVNASDEYVEHLANLFQHGDRDTGDSGIPSDINLYVEYSNEMWHNQFHQGNWNFNSAQDEVKAGTTNLDYDGKASTPDQWRFRRIAKRTIEIGRQFRKAFADRPQRIRPVINNHLIEFDFDMLQYVTANYGKPSDVLYGISQQGYYTSLDSSSVESVLDGEKEASNKNKSNYAMSRTLATYFGLHSLAYEGGQDEKGGDTPAVPDKGFSNKLAAARAPRMKDVIAHDLLDNWFPSGGELYVTFSQVGRYSYWGTFGQTEDLTNLKTGKWIGHTAVMEAPVPPLAVGIRLPPLTGKAVELAVNSGASDKVIPPGPGPWAMFLFSVSARGSYSFLAHGKPNGPNCEVRFMIDNLLAGKSTLPSDPGDGSGAQPVTAALEPGLHSLFLFLDGEQTMTVSPASKIIVTQTGSAAN